MKRFTGTEKAALILAAVLLFGGASLVIWPQSGVVPHIIMVTNTAANSFVDSMNAPKSRFVGSIAMAFGACLGAFTIYRGKT